MEENKVSLLSLFLVMAKIGAFTIGGGYAMLQLIQQELCSRKWIPEDEFPDLIALSQAAPGLLAVNISIFAGYRIHGVKGAVVATVGTCFPPFLVILLIAVFGSSYADNPAVVAAFKGMRPAVVALILVPMIRMARTSCRRWWQWALAAGALAAVAFARVSPVYVLIIVIVAGVIMSLAAAGKEGGAHK